MPPRNDPAIPEEFNRLFDAVDQAIAMLKAVIPLLPPPARAEIAALCANPE